MNSRYSFYSEWFSIVLRSLQAFRMTGILQTAWAFGKGLWEPAVAMALRLNTNIYLIMPLVLAMKSCLHVNIYINILHQYHSLYHSSIFCTKFWLCNKIWNFCNHRRSWSRGINMRSGGVLKCPAPNYFSEMAGEPFTAEKFYSVTFDEISGHVD